MPRRHARRHRALQRQGRAELNAYDFSGLFAHLEDLISEEAEEPNRIGADVQAIDTANPAELDSSFVARFGRVIARRGVAAVPRALFTHQKALGITPQQVWFVSYIFSFQWSTTLPYPSINKMVQHTGYSRAHLHTIKAELVDAGYLTWCTEPTSREGRTQTLTISPACWTPSAPNCSRTRY